MSVFYLGALHGRSRGPDRLLNALRPHAELGRIEP